MATITFENGARVDFQGTPTQRDIEEVAASLGFNKAAPKAPQTNPLDERSAELYRPSFPARTGDSPVAAGLKTAGNLPSSAINLGKTVVDAVAHPLRTAEAVGNSVTGALDKFVAPKLGLPQDQRSVDTFEALSAAMKERYGSPENLQRSLTNDPVGVVTDFLALAGGGAAAAGKGATTSKLISSTASPITKSASAVASTVAEKTGQTARFATSQATGLAPETISAAVARPAELSAAQKSGLNRATLAQDLQSTIDKRISSLSDLGEGYQTIRELPVEVKLPEDWFSSILKKHKLQVQDGQIVASKESLVLSPTDKAALQSFHDLYGRDPLHSPNSFLNTREALTQLAKYDAAKTGNLQAIARDARAELNRFRNQVDGLKELDDQYAPEVADLRQVKNEWIDSKTGELKDTAYTRIANATNAGRDKILERLETIQPGITKQIKLLRAVEDIENTKGNKIGTYTRSAVAGGGLLTGNVPLILGAIISQPEIAIPLLKGIGYTKRTARPIIDALKSAGGDINNFRLPTGVQNYLKEAQPGLSMKKSPVRKSDALNAAVEELRKQLKYHPDKATRQKIAKQLTALLHELSETMRADAKSPKKKDAK